MHLAADSVQAAPVDGQIAIPNEPQLPARAQVFFQTINMQWGSEIRTHKYLIRLKTKQAVFFRAILLPEIWTKCPECRHHSKTKHFGAKKYHFWIF